MKFTSSLKLKLIYVFRINDEAHKGCLKVGEATCDDETVFGLSPNSKSLNLAAKKRINQYTQTAGIAYDLLYTELTIYNKKGSLCSFNDKEVHEVLERSGIKKKEFNKEANANEWFVTDLETVKHAIAAVKEGRNSLNIAEISNEMSPIVFRPEQLDAISQTEKQFKKSNQMLWNAKMRFGKTLSALQVIKDMSFCRTLILTHRPVVDNGWFEDFGKIFYDSPNYTYGSKNNGDTFDTLEQRAKKGNRYVYFASMQDLRGSEQVGGNFNKNHKVFSTPWNLIIVDEAHEGTQTELGKAVMKELTKKDTKVLRLSGTPFNLFDDFKEDEIYTWDYVMEQRAKKEWDKTHFGDPNPYALLPCLNIYTYNLGKLLHEYIDEDIAFNFREFFRTNENGNFIHERDVLAFLNLLSKNDKYNCYPFSNDEYRKNFRHTLWLVPGVKEAKALSSLLQKHEVFQHFHIVNVAGNGDEEEESSDALQAVEKAIGPNPEETYTITLSCGRLTTGVSVKAWTAVLMLSGSFSTSASNYMQTIFRVQTPATINGRMKEECYVFDFAPDRTLKVIAETAKISSKAGKTSQKDRDIMGEFLNFCPIISVEGSQMKPYDVPKMLEQLKRAYIERVVRNGFEDGYLYNDELMKLNDVDLNEFKELKGVIGSTRAMAKTNDIDINNQGFTDEQYEEQENAEKKRRKNEPLSEEEKRLLKEKEEKKKNRDNAISILRGISIRMPLLIYGAELNNEDEDITIENFASLIDSQSWVEFMPKGVTKQLFNKFKKYYDPEIFCAAGKRIRSMAQVADRLSIEERIERITAIFNTFRNPDKETVLTPWRVVNMHLGDCLGGYKFYDETNTRTIEEPAYIEHGEVTPNVFNPKSRVLEINSKSGLYPLYVTYSIYRSRLAIEQNSFGVLSPEQKLALWDMTVKENVFVVCKTTMAKSITKRTLIGFRNAKVNTRYFEDLINQITNKPQHFIDKIKNGKTYWKANDNENMKFNAIVGNPPYQVSVGIVKDNYGLPIYNKFIDISKKMSPNYISMISPSRWFTGGRGLDDFRKEMLNDNRLAKIFDFVDSKECFPNVDISGGINYFLWDNKYNGNCEFTNIIKSRRETQIRKLDEYKIFIRNNHSLSIIDKVLSDEKSFLNETVSGQTPFGFITTYRGRSNKFDGCIKLKSSGETTYVSMDEIKKNQDWVNVYKVIFSKATCEHAGTPDKNGQYRVLSYTDILKPNVICTQSYLVGNVFENYSDASHFLSYLKTKLVRYLILQSITSQDISSDKFQFVPMQDFTSNSDIDWNKSIPDIDQQLYAKYGLTEEEISFVNGMIKPME